MDSGMWLLVLVFGPAIIGLGWSLLGDSIKDTYKYMDQKGVHFGRLALVVFIGVCTLTILLHIFSPSFRGWFNDQLVYWWRTAPLVDVLLFTLVLAGFGMWAYKTWRGP